MEPRGRSRWQPVANQIGAEAAKMSGNRCRGLRPLPESFHGKEEVDGSGPSEVSPKSP